ncbi:MAG: GNAT family protein [Candidatus Nealsonbacteria bacterium]
MKNQRVKIKGKRIFLKTLNERNATKEYCSWLNDPAVNKYLETRKATISQLKEYIKKKNKSPNSLFLGIFFKKNQKHIGNIKLEPIDFKKKKATVGILIGNKDYWGQGFGKEAISALVDYAFNNLALQEINLGVISENKVAVNLYKNVGFKIDRIEKKSIRHEKKLFDKMIMLIKK